MVLENDGKIISYIFCHGILQNVYRGRSTYRKKRLKRKGIQKYRYKTKKGQLAKEGTIIKLMTRLTKKTIVDIPLGTTL